MGFSSIDPVWSGLLVERDARSACVLCDWCVSGSDAELWSHCKDKQPEPTAFSYCLL